MAERSERYPISMEELRKTCPLVEVDVIADSSGGDILIGKWQGVVQVRVACKKVNKAAVEKFREAYFKAIRIGAIKAAASPKPPIPATIATGDATGSTAAPVDASSDIQVEEEPEV